MSSPAAEAAAGPRLDRLLNGRLGLWQATTGHRVGTDAIVLAAAAPMTEGLIVDAGAGVGAVGAAAALRMPGATLELVEIDEGSCALARQNLELNGLSSRGRVVCADLMDPLSRRAAGLADESAALVLSNPPFHERARVRVSPDASKATAHVFDSAGGAPALDRWMRTLTALAAPRAWVIAIHRADRLDDVLAAFAGRLGAISVLPIYPSADKAAHRVLVAGQKGSRAAMRIAPGLVLHRSDGSFTERAEAIHRGEAVIDIVS